MKGQKCSAMSRQKEMPVCVILIMLGMTDVKANWDFAGTRERKNAEIRWKRRRQ